MSKNYTGTNSTSRIIFVKVVEYVFNNNEAFSVTKIFNILAPFGFDAIHINRFIKELVKTNILEYVNNKTRVKLNKENFDSFLKVKINKTPYPIKQYLNSLSREEYDNLLDLTKPFIYEAETENIVSDSPKDKINIPPEDSSPEECAPKAFSDAYNKLLGGCAAKAFSDAWDQMLEPEKPIEVTDPFENITPKNTDSFSEDFDKFLVYVKSLEDLTEKLLKENQDLKTKLETSDSHLNDLSRQMNNFGMKIKQRDYIPSNVLVMNS